MMQLQTTTQWALEHGTRMRYASALDNYPVPRNVAYGDLFIYDRDDRGNANDIGIVIPDGLDKFPRAPHCLFLVDDGRSVQVFYVASWHDTDRHIIAHPMPTNYDRDGNRRTRADDGRPVDFSNWELGPRTAYHLKLHA
jgi:hypothetical protein